MGSKKQVERNQVNSRGSQNNINKVISPERNGIRNGGEANTQSP